MEDDGQMAYRDALIEPGIPQGLLVGIVYNLKRTNDESEAEFDEPETVEAIRAALADAGCATQLIEADSDLPARLAGIRPDIVFNIAEGAGGRSREAQVPALLEYLGIPYAGSDPTTMCLALDKALCKQLLVAHGISTPRWHLVESQGVGASSASGICSGEHDGPLEGLHEAMQGSYPVIVKPDAEGSSKGISGNSVAEGEAALDELVRRGGAAYPGGLLVEEFIPGREFTVGIVGNGSSQVVFPPMEVIYRHQGGSDVYGLEVKHDFRSHIDYACPAEIADALQQELMGMAAKAHAVLGCRDMSRTDFRVSPEGKPYLIEVNPLPGLEPGYSDFPMLAGFCAVDYPVLVRAILAAALARYGMMAADGPAGRGSIQQEGSHGGERQHDGR